MMMKISQIIGRCIHTTARRSRIYLSKDESCFVAYHPDKDHPYECTKPMPEVVQDESILRVDSKNMITKAPNLEQLQALTYTSRRHWHNYEGAKKRMKYRNYFNDNVDRKGLTT